MTNRFKRPIQIFIFSVSFLFVNSILNFIYSNSNIYLAMLFLNIQFVINVGVIIFWGISINRRIMNRSIRRYLLIVAFSATILLLQKSIKWSAFLMLDLEGRLMWYMFYIPMIVTPLMGLFIALSINKDEDSKINKRWYLLLIPAVLLIIMVLTNDFHQFVFKFNENFVDWNNDYGYETGYFLIAVFLLLIVLSTLFIIFKKWRAYNRKKRAYLPIFVILMGLVYCLTYVVNRPLAGVIIDMTTFSCFIYILFLESCIQVGMIQENTYHSIFFGSSKLAVQILDNDANMMLKSSFANSISQDQFSKLREMGQLSIDENNFMNMTKISRGFVVWENDLSKLAAMQSEYNRLNRELRFDIDILNKEQGFAAKNARMKKLAGVYKRIEKEIFPYLEKIEQLATDVETKDKAQQERILKIINLISCYTKRRINLLLKTDNGDELVDSDMISSYNECFRGLELFGTECSLKYKTDVLLVNSKQHLLCFDFFGELLMCSGFNLQQVVLNCFTENNKLRFSVNISKSKSMFWEEVERLKSNAINLADGLLKVYEEEDSLAIILLLDCEVI